MSQHALISKAITGAFVDALADVHGYFGVKEKLWIAWAKKDIAVGAVANAPNCKTTKDGLAERIIAYYVV